MITALTEKLKLRYPLVNAPMTPQAGGLLAGTVARAGALGMLGLDENEPEASMLDELRLLRETAGGAPFGIGLVRWVIDQRPALIDLAIAARPAIVSISFGDPAPFVPRFHEAGILVASQVQSKGWAETALAAGVDIIVAQGTEGGGHTGNVGTLPLLQIVLELAGETPVVAAGGIATGRGLAAVLAAGACGAWIGTPFLGASEARTNAEAVRRLVGADETETILTSAFDRVQHKAWPAEFRGRALRNSFTDAWTGREDDITADAEAAFLAARSARDYTVANIYAGQTVGLVRSVESAATIVERIASDAEQRLQAVGDITACVMAAKSDPESTPR
jgi:nitronate monooxygenase